MKCLFFASWWPTDDAPISGVFIKEHARAVSLFSEIVVVHFKPLIRIIHPRNFPFRTEIDFKKEDGIDTYIITSHVALRKFGIARYAAKKVLKKIMLELHNKYSFDLININVLSNNYSEVMMEENILPGLPIIISEHSSFSASEINLLSEKEKKKKKQQLIRLLNDSRVKKILPVSNFLAKTMIKEYSVSPERIEIVPNIANDIFRYHPLLNKNEINCKIVLAAHWAYPKNPFSFLEVLTQLSANELRHFKIDWFGDGPLMKEIKMLTEKLSMPVITFHGYQPKTVIAEYLQAASFLLHPTDKETFSCIVMESLCCGTPVLSNNVSGVSELINDSNGILVGINNEAAMREAMKIMMENQNQFDRKKISETAKNKFSKEVVGEKIVSLYQEILN